MLLYPLHGNKWFAQGRDVISFYLIIWHCEIWTYEKWKKKLLKKGGKTRQKQNYLVLSLEQIFLQS